MTCQLYVQGKQAKDELVGGGGGWWCILLQGEASNSGVTCIGGASYSGVTLLRDRPRTRPGPIPGKSTQRSKQDWRKVGENCTSVLSSWGWEPKASKKTLMVS